MAQRRGVRSLDPERALEISIDGTAIRLAGDDSPVLEAVAQLRELVGDRVDLLARAAGTKIGGYLGQPLSSPLTIKAAYLLILAGNGQDHATLVDAADTTRRLSGGSAYSL